MRVLTGHYQALTEVTNTIFKHRELTLEMARREIADRYVGQTLGIFWSLLHPLFLLSVYIFVFCIVFKNKLGGTVEMPRDYTTYLLSGIIAWLGFQESLAKACVAITGNASLVKQVVFPIEVIPVKGVLSSLFQQCIMLALLLCYVGYTYHTVPWTYALIPLLLVIQAAAMIGIAYFLSSIGVFFRDLKDFVQMFAVAGIYLLPIVYLPTWVPPLFKPFLYINPFSHYIWCWQDVLYFGRIEHPFAWKICVIQSMLFLIFGYRLFRKLKIGFGNVL